MKKYSIVFLIFCLFVIKVSAQSLELYLDGELLSTDTIDVYGNVEADTLYTYIFQGDTTYYYAYEALVEIDVKNTGASSLDVQCRKRHIQLTAETLNYFCWSSCFPPYTFESTKAINIEPSHTDTIFSGHYKPSGQLGCTMVAYTFFDDKNHSDSAMVVVRYIMDNCHPNSIKKDMVGQQIFSKPYPNPASTYFIISKDRLYKKSGQITIFNSLGQRMQTIDFQPSSSRIFINAEAFKLGTYYYRISSDNKIQDSGKFIILR